MAEGVNMSVNTTELTAGQRRIAKAQATRVRTADEKLAERLRAHGWSVVSPEDLAEFNQAIQAALRQP
jgi:hypothetical protein